MCIVKGFDPCPWQAKQDIIETDFGRREPQICQSFNDANKNAVLFVAALFEAQADLERL